MSASLGGTSAPAALGRNRDHALAGAGAPGRLVVVGVALGRLPFLAPLAAEIGLVHLDMPRSSPSLSCIMRRMRWPRDGRKFPAHLRVNHSAGEYVRRDPHAAATAHTNTAEAFNATLKRALIGVWHRFSIKHTDRYLHEVAF